MCEMLNISSLNSINSGIYNTQQIGSVKQNSAAQSPAQTTPVFTHTAKPSFGVQNSVAAVRTTLSGKEEQEKYNVISAMVDKKVKKDLHELLKTGKLLDTGSNDRTTTLDNLYKIATQKRIAGLNTKTIVEDVISTIQNPFNITQKFGDIPVNLQNEIIEEEKKQGKNISVLDLNVKSSTCPAASIEFNLAHKMPAEFARIAEGLTSEAMSVQKTINVSDLSQGLMDTIWMLNEFGTEHKLDNWNTLRVTLRPDRNAIVRARVQNTYRDPGERSAIDVLMQSTFMNVGAQNTYDTVIDKRIPKYNEDDSGLIDIEKNFAEELATGKGIVCVTYQQIDDNGRLVG